MAVEQILFLLQIIGTIASFAAVILVGLTIYMNLATPYKKLKQYVIDTTPEPEPEPIPKRRVVTITVSPEVQTRLDELLPAADLHNGWDRIGGSKHEASV